MFIYSIFVFSIFYMITCIVAAEHFDNKFDIIDLLGLNDHATRFKRHPLETDNSASKYLLEIYKKFNEDKFLDITDDDIFPKLYNNKKKRHKRSTDFITKRDWQEIEKCNNIITFASKNNKITFIDADQIIGGSSSEELYSLYFNTNDVPKDLQLFHASLRIYKESTNYNEVYNDNITISIYQKVFNQQLKVPMLQIISSVNTFANYEGWFEFNITRLLFKWLRHRTLHHIINGNQIVIGISSSYTRTHGRAYELGIILPDTLNPSSANPELQPFVIGYFNGPELLAKVQKLRFKRDAMKRSKTRVTMRAPPPPAYKQPKTCERLNFTLDFRDLHMHNWVIAPKKFEAFFCGGECNFPLGAKMNATNHAIVQTLMHLKNSNLPKPCCVPTVLGSISILHHLNDDSVNLSRYPKSVALECGCH